MRKSIKLLCMIFLILGLAGCGPQGGTVTLINETRVNLTNSRISMGNAGPLTLYPGQSMKSSIDKNDSNFQVRFHVPSVSDFNTNYLVTGLSGGFTNVFYPNRWVSVSFAVGNGEDIFVIVREK